jgi:GNAT acetyltransferase-like protein
VPDGAGLSRSRGLENREPLTADPRQPLRTGRLLPVALTPELARTTLDHSPKLGLLLGARVPETWLGADFARMLPRIAQGVEEASPGAKPTRLLVHAADKTLIGETEFHGPPDGSGKVEVGYSIVPTYRARGLATEATRALIEASLQRPDIQPHHRRVPRRQRRLAPGAREARDAADRPRGRDAALRTAGGLGTGQLPLACFGQTVPKYRPETMPPYGAQGPPSEPSCRRRITRGGGTR